VKYLEIAVAVEAEADFEVARVLDSVAEGFE
jgi:hypothetical protein